MLEAEAVEWTLRDRRLWILSAGSDLYLVGQVALLSFFVLFLHDQHGLTDAAAAAGLAVMQVGARGDEDLGRPDLGFPRREDSAPALDRPGQLRGRLAHGGSYERAGCRRPAGDGRRGGDLDGLERALRDGGCGACGPRAKRRCDRVPADDAVGDGPDRPRRVRVRGRLDVLGEPGSRSPRSGRCSAGGCSAGCRRARPSRARAGGPTRRRSGRCGSPRASARGWSPAGARAPGRGRRGRSAAPSPARRARAPSSSRARAARR